MRLVYRTCRSLLNRPKFCFAIILTLALGIGANSAIFSVIDAVLLQPLPYPGGDRVVAIFQSNPDQQVVRGDLSPAQVEEWNTANHSFVAIAAAAAENVAETSGALPEKLVRARISPRFFSVLGMPPIIGRFFSPDEDQTNGPRAAIVSERFWKRRFGADPAAIGQSLRFSDESFPIVGVLPDSFHFPSPGVDVWAPAQLRPVVMRMREQMWYSTVGLLKPGVNIRTAQADLASIQNRLGKQFPVTDAHWTPIVEHLEKNGKSTAGRPLWILFGSVSLLLLIACVNVACLLLADGKRREREIAICFSLGARRGQIIRDLLAESLCLAVPGAALGLIASVWGASLFRHAAGKLPRIEQMQLDWRIVLFTLSIGLATTLLFGLLPAFQITRYQGSRSQVSGQQPLLRALVAAQIALAIVLVVGAGLLIRTLSELGRVPLGFQPDPVLTFRMSASWAEKAKAALVRQRIYRTIDALRTIPGVEDAATTLTLPGGGDVYPQPFDIVGRNTITGVKSSADLQLVAPHYFHVLGIPILSGQTCRETLDSNPIQPALVNRAFADKFFPNQNPLQQHLATPPPSPVTFEIVAVVGDVHEHGYAQDPQPTIYSCGAPGFFPDPEFMVKAQGNPMLLAESIRQKLGPLEPSRAVYDVKRLSDYLSSSLDERRFQTLLLSLFGSTALLLAAIGLYGVMSFIVSQRTREIGLRVALGARPAQVLAQVYRQGAVTAGTGMLAGLGLAVLLTRYISSLLFGVKPFDGLTFGAVIVLLAVVAAFATWGPARRATQVDPMEALRQE
ncbi:MAG TPA: ABC transporter permease [Bryobacteraceae bacterium]|nr:ABC transporter permease [Bryobacteraceae bacterium]